VLESLPEDERAAYTTLETVIYRLEEKGGLKKVKKLAMRSSLSRPSIKANSAADGCATCWTCLAVRRAFWYPICLRVAV
jgi:predicted transcriptional regulator